MSDTVCENEGTVSRANPTWKLYQITGGCALDCIALIDPEADLDGRFNCFDIDNNEWMTVNGWNCDITLYVED